ncbi:GIY-YIG nuclease family protein [bacterium]|nr:GIY-YIG nuclease family protein [bacterium]
MKKYVVYILRCENGTFYTGFTRNVEMRLHHHNNGTGAKYTARHNPCTLVYQEEFDDREIALHRELQIKKKNRMSKKFNSS